MTPDTPLQLHVPWLAQLSGLPISLRVAVVTFDVFIVVGEQRQLVRQRRRHRSAQASHQLHEEEPKAADDDTESSCRRQRGKLHLNITMTSTR